MKQLFIIARLELIGYNKYAIRFLLETLFYLTTGESVEVAFLHFLPLIFLFSREGHNGFVLTLSLLQKFRDGLIVLDGTDDAGRHHHRPCLATHFTL